MPWKLTSHALLLSAWTLHIGLAKLHHLFQINHRYVLDLDLEAAIFVIGR